MIPRTHQRSSIARLLAFGLLVLCVLLGPVGQAGSIASAFGAVATCPCEDEAGHPHDVSLPQVADAHPGEADCGATLHAAGGEACGDHCPDDCANCSCCRGAAVAILTLPVASADGVAPAVSRSLAHVDTLTPSEGTGFFRPPRSRT